MTGAVAGLVAITPASGFAAPMTSILLGFVASAVCYLFVAVVKNKLKYDDTLDVFGVHCIGGIVGAIGDRYRCRPVARWSGLLRLHRVPGRSRRTYDMAAQVITQIKAVGITRVCGPAVVSAVLFYGLQVHHSACVRPKKRNAKVSTSPAMENAPTIIEFQSLAAGRSLLSFYAPPPQDVPPANIQLTARTQWFGPFLYEGERRGAWTAGNKKGGRKDRLFLSDAAVFKRPWLPCPGSTGRPPC